MQRRPRHSSAKKSANASSRRRLTTRKTPTLKKLLPRGKRAKNSVKPAQSLRRRNGSLKTPSKTKMQPCSCAILDGTPTRKTSEISWSRSAISNTLCSARLGATCWKTLTVRRPSRNRITRELASCALILKKMQTRSYSFLRTWRNS